MATLNVSGGVHITLLKNGDSLNTTLNSTSPLYQTFKKGTSDFNPDWATMPDAERPVIYPRVYSTMQAMVLVPSNEAWKYNGVEMAFDGSGVATAPEICAGKIQQIDHNGSKALKMIGNVASDTNNDSDTITFEGTVEASGQSIPVTAETTILVEEAAANLYRLFLNTADDVIDGDQESITMVASLFNTGVEVETGAQFEFLDIGGAVLKAKSPSDTLTITKAMIDSELIVVCKAYIGTIVVAQEQRQVWDATDPFVVLCNQGTNPRQSALNDVVYGFTLMNARTGSVVAAVFDIKVYKDSDSSDITSEFPATTDTSITIPGAKISEHEAIFLEASTTVDL